MALSVASEVQTPPQSIFFHRGHTPEQEPDKIENRQHAWNRLREWARRESKQEQSSDRVGSITDAQLQPAPLRPGLGVRLSKKVGVGIPRSTTFQRQEEEQRKNLEPVIPSFKERKEVSRVRQRALSAQPIPPRSLRRQGSAPEVGDYHTTTFPSIEARMENGSTPDPFQPRPGPSAFDQRPPSPPRPPDVPPGDASAQYTDAAITEASYDDVVDEEIRDELERKWILNLSMHFRDKSPREKFFLTYAETPQKWRRVTISVDYRDAPLDSLEADLQALTSQRDKSARVYESIRMSLRDIQFYDTVTNLKLETRDDRLHVHVTEDINEIIPYPSSRSVRHLSVRRIRESDLRFVEHMSGFVYKVDVGEHTWIKKEIPGPDSVEEFLYEINALNDLIGSKNVIELKGLVINDEDTLVKGLLIGYADKGALVDVLYDNRGHLPWRRRERWAKQIVRGLSEIHEAGFVQGDFTLSNIVIDGKDKAKVIDINRRGCPVGWEPPEIGCLIENGQRISMFIGVKSDIYQLGMVLWALAMEQDEPERQARPLLDHKLPHEIPSYYHDLLARCLSAKPAERISGKDLLHYFPKFAQKEQSPQAFLNLTGLNDRLLTTDTPDASIQELDFSDPTQIDLPAIKAEKLQGLGLQVTPDPKSKSIDLNEDGLIPQNAIDLSPFRELIADPMDLDRGRQLLNKERHFSFSTDNISPGASEGDGPNVIAVSPTGDRKWAEITLDGTPYLVPRDTLDSSDEEDRFGNKAETPTKARRAPQRNSAGIGEFEHVDSGLADMDLAVGGTQSGNFTKGNSVRSGTDQTINEQTAFQRETPGAKPQKEAEEGDSVCRGCPEQHQKSAALGISGDLGSACNERQMETNLGVG